jgi:hypothetical protein
MAQASSTNTTSSRDGIRGPDGRMYRMPDNPLILMPLARIMNVELVVKEEDATTVVLHNKPLPRRADWAEFDRDLGTLTFVTWDGAIFDLGMKVHAPLADPMARATRLNTIYMEHGETIAGVDYCPLIIRHIGV